MQEGLTVVPEELVPYSAPLQAQPGLSQEKGDVGPWGLRCLKSQ